VSLVKSKQRVADHGEVFTPAWMVEAMLDLVKGETERIDSRFLEPACGDGNFLAPVLRRKLAAVELKYGIHSTYQDAAHSMSAVGMLAPLLETVFYQCFQNIGKRFYPATHPHKTHDRWLATHGIQWDCHFVVTNDRTHKNIVDGIFQLSDAVGLTSRFPADLKAVLSALFAYRNNMFHHGFEWTVEERKNFAKRIKNEGWPTDWFSVATSDGKPWIFSLSDKFIRHCNKTIEEVLQAIGGFVRDELLPKEGGAS
jgi:hypothetical protein